LAVRTGTLWEGRYKASPVDSESHVLHCQRYIDLNPVRARMTDDPADYPWSNCPAHCGRRSDAMLTPHPAYTALASEPASFCAKPCPTTTWTYLQQQRALGRDDFRAMVEAKTQRFAGIRPANRPPRRGSNACK
jgi:putative transposase